MKTDEFGNTDLDIKVAELIQEQVKKQAGEQIEYWRKLYTELAEKYNGDNAFKELQNKCNDLLAKQHYIKNQIEELYDDFEYNISKLKDLL